MKRMMQRSGRWLLLGSLLLAGACKVSLGDEKRGDDTEASDDDDDDNNASKKKKRKKRKKRKTRGDDDKSGSSLNDAHEGRFVFKTAPATKTPLKPYEALFNHGRLKSLIDVMGIVALPRDVPVTVGECGIANAYYMQKKHAVVLCYELAHDFYTKFRAKGADDQKASDQTLNALTFVLLHEMGHAVIGELDLGVTGGEEDAVDDLAALILIDAKQPQWAIDGALSMALLTQGQKPNYVGEHSLGEQRFYNITCAVFGSNPEKFKVLVEKNVLPVKRARRCRTEYERKNKAWTGMLAPHLRKK